MLPSTPRTNPDLCLYSLLSLKSFAVFIPQSGIPLFPSQTVVLSIILGIPGWDTTAAFRLMKPLQE